MLNERALRETALAFAFAGFAFASGCVTPTGRGGGMEQADLPWWAGGLHTESPPALAPKGFDAGEVKLQCLQSSDIVIDDTTDKAGGTLRWHQQTSAYIADRLGQDDDVLSATGTALCGTSEGRARVRVSMEPLELVQLTPYSSNVIQLQLTTVLPSGAEVRSDPIAATLVDEQYASASRWLLLGGAGVGLIGIVAGFVSFGSLLPGLTGPPPTDEETMWGLGAAGAGVVGMFAMLGIAAVLEFKVFEEQEEAKLEFLERALQVHREDLEVVLRAHAQTQDESASDGVRP